MSGRATAIGIGVHGMHENNSGLGYGVFGTTLLPIGYAGYFLGGKGVYISPRLGIGNFTPQHPIHAGFGVNGNGVHLTSGGMWLNGSSRSFKTDIASVDPEELLAALSSTPIYRWKYKDSDEEGWHVGPIAEDFYSAFGLGESAQYIATGDIYGVIMASTQAFAQKCDRLENEIEELKQIIKKHYLLSDASSSKNN